MNARNVDLSDMCNPQKLDPYWASRQYAEVAELWHYERVIALAKIAVRSLAGHLRFVILSLGEVLVTVFSKFTRFKEGP